MRKITFISSLDLGFGRKKVYDYSPSRTFVTRGMDIPKLKQDIADVRKGNSRLKDMFVQERKDLKHKQGLNQITVRGMRLNYRVEHNSRIDPLQQPLSKRLESYKFNKEKNKEFAEVDNWLENRKKRSQPIESPKPTNNAAPKVDSNTTKTSTSLLQPKSKLGMKGKLGLGAIGLATVGAVGYGIARKLRSDKGKKRGKYLR